VGCVHGQVQPGPASGQSRSGPTGKVPARLQQCTLQADAAARVVFGGPGALLDESACAAVGVIAEQPVPSTTPPPDDPIREGPPTAAGNGYAPRAVTRAPSAARPPRPRMRIDHQRIAGLTNAIDHHRRQMRKQNPGDSIREPQTQSTTLGPEGLTESAPEPNKFDHKPGQENRAFHSQRPWNGSPCLVRTCMTLGRCRWRRDVPVFPCGPRGGVGAVDRCGRFDGLGFRAEFRFSGCRVVALAVFVVAIRCTGRRSSRPG
jgi:hypothetical protein